MRIIAVSDTHGNVLGLKKILEKHKDIRHIFFLGDCVKDIERVNESFEDREFYVVSGNCDPFSLYKNIDICTVNGVNILFTHGHTLGVKGGLERLTDTANKRGCKLALFGHTHCAVTIYDNGLTIVNPGSAGHSRNGSNSYAVIDVTANGIVTSIMELN